MRKTTVIGFLGTTLDQGRRNERWNKWRPSVSVCQQEDLLVSKYYLIVQESAVSLADWITKDIHFVSPETEVIPVLVSIKDPWDFQEMYSLLFDFSKKLKIDSEKEDVLVHITTGTHVAQICLFLLTESRHFPGKLLQSSPYRKTSKDKNEENKGDKTGVLTVIDLDLAKYDGLAARFKKQKLDDISLLKSGIKTRNKQFNLLIEEIETVAIRSNDPILLTGPTGAGKSQLARRIFDLKKVHNQTSGRFVEVNCAILRGDGAMSTLFGHKKGSFTGAINDRPGLLMSADKGICFLDEIGELGLDEQAMLLRAIEEKTFLPLGSDDEIKSDFQLICGSNKDLQLGISEGTFREDLYARINLWTFLMPSLKERLEDIEPNLQYELTKYAEDSGRKISFNNEAKGKFLSFAVSPEAAWESNFRDLNGSVKRMSTLAPGGRITESTVQDEIGRLKKRWLKSTAKESAVLKTVLTEDEISEIDMFDRITLEGVLFVCRESANLSEAGRKLFKVSRNKKQNLNDADRIGKFLKRFNISWVDIKR